MDRILGNRMRAVHVLYRIGIAIEGETLILRKEPPGCAARLLVEPHRQIERQDQVGKVNADARRGLVTAKGFAQPVLAAAQFQQKRIVFAGMPGLRLGRNGRHRNAESRPKQGGQAAQRRAAVPHDVGVRSPIRSAYG